jgi:dTMP kinase
MKENVPMSYFFSLEGGEGVGKTTQKNLLIKRLPLLFPEREFVFTREPGGSPFAEKIRALILSEDAKHADGKTMFGLFVAARHDHMSQVILPALSAGKIVISDRFIGATYAYQLFAQDGEISKELYWAHHNALERTPDLTMVFDMDPRVAQERVSKRAGEVATHFDTRALEFHLRLREGYRDFAAYHPTTLVDAARTPEEVHQEVIGHIRTVLD